MSQRLSLSLTTDPSALRAHGVPVSDERYIGCTPILPGHLEGCVTGAEPMCSVLAGPEASPWEQERCLD